MVHGRDEVRIHGADEIGVGLFAVQHVKIVCGLAVIITRRNHVLPFPDTHVVRHDNGKRRTDSFRAAQLPFRSDVIGVRIAQGESRAGHAQRVDHGRFARGCRFEHVLGRARQFLTVLKARLERRKLCFIRELVVPQKKRGLFKRRVRSKLHERMPTDKEFTGEPVHIAQPRLCRSNTFKAGNYFCSHDKAALPLLRRVTSPSPLHAHQFR